MFIGLLKPWYQLILQFCRDTIGPGTTLLRCSSTVDACVTVVPRLLIVWGIDPGWCRCWACGLHGGWRLTNVDLHPVHEVSGDVDGGGTGLEI